MDVFEENPLQDDISDKTDEHKWSLDVERQLQNIEQNATQQANISKSQYIELIWIQKHFKIPVIILSGMNSIFAIGLNNFINQNAVSVLNCILAFIVGVMGSIELYLGITMKMNIALNSYQSFYLLSVKINNCLRLERDHRNEMDGKAFLVQCLNEYEQLFQQNNITADFYEDKLTNVELITKK
jgi:hypothetical protein